MGATQDTMVVPPGRELRGTQGEFFHEIGEPPIVRMASRFEAEYGDRLSSDLLPVHHVVPGFRVEQVIASKVALWERGGCQSRSALRVPAG